MKTWISITLSALILMGGTAAVYKLNDKWSHPVAEAASALGKPGVSPTLKLPRQI